MTTSDASVGSSTADQHDGRALREPLLPPPSGADTPQHAEDAPPARLVDGMPLGTSILLKSLYFLEALGSSTWGRFSTIYYNTHQLDPSQM